VAAPRPAAWHNRQQNSPPDRGAPGLTGKSSLAYCPHVTSVFDALAAEARRLILDELAERDGQALYELCARLALKHDLTLTRQAVSQHLEVLEAAGLVRCVREGRCKFHFIDTRPLEETVRRWSRLNKETRGTA
jgi:DNA-binding transcriptional ArsR family regulator